MKGFNIFNKYANNLKFEIGEKEESPLGVPMALCTLHFTLCTLHFPLLRKLKVQKDVQTCSILHFALYTFEGVYFFKSAKCKVPCVSKFFLSLIWNNAKHLWLFKCGWASKFSFSYTKNSHEVASACKHFIQHWCSFRQFNPWENWHRPIEDSRLFLDDCHVCQRFPWQLIPQVSCCGSIVFE